MKLYWCPQSRAQRAIWLMEELGEPYERVLIDIRDPSKPRDPDFAKASPMGKVPALSDGDVHMADSAAIATYVADKYPAAGLAPGVNDPARGAYLYWMFFVPGVMEPAMTEKVAGFKPNPAQYGHGSYAQMVDVLASGLEGKTWILGDTFSAADVMLGSTANFMKMFGMLDPHPTIDAYVERCTARPAFQRVVEINDAGR